MTAPEKTYGLGEECGRPAAGRQNEIKGDECRRMIGELHHGHDLRNSDGYGARWWSVHLTT
jgi:hypothetical protein